MLAPITFFKTKKAAEAIAGSLSKPSKMPGHGYGLPAAECKTGKILAQTVPDSPCADCYACKGRYVFPNVQSAQYNRLSALNNPLWVDAMVTLIQKTGDDYFRWHDSGDIQSIEHLRLIVDIAERVPLVKFWLPTQERKMVNEYIRQHGAFPDNLVVRISSPRIDQAVAHPSLPTSSVHRNKPAVGYECPAPKQNNTCGDCRACWSKDISNISYHHH